MLKNKLVSDGVWLYLLEINIPSFGTIYLTSDNQNTVWNGNTYIPLAFNFSEIPQSSKSEVPQWTLNVGNQNGVIGRYIESYDVYIKNNGIQGNIISCNWYCVNSKDLSNLTPYGNEAFELDTITVEDYATFVLKGDNLTSIMFPKRRGSKMFCAWKFKGTECKYAGSATECFKSLANCAALDNTINFGGFPAVGGNAVVTI